MKRHYPTFSEKTLEILDFARCQRADGSFYGTSGQCRKGKEVGPKEIKALQAKAQAGDSKAKEALKKISKVEDPDAAKQAKTSSPSVKSESSKPIKELDASKKPETQEKGASDKTKKALENLGREEKETQEKISSLKKQLETTSEWDDKYDQLDSQLSRAKEALKVLADDRKALENGALDGPPSKPLSDAQKTRVSAQIDALKSKVMDGTYTPQEYEKYSTLKTLRDSEDPKAAAKAIKELKDAKAAMEEARKEDTRRLATGEDRGNLLSDARQRLNNANDAIASLKVSKEERFGKYLVSNEYEKGSLAPSRDAWKSQEKLDSYTKDWQKRNGLDDVTAAHDRYHSAIHSYLGRSSEDFAKASGTKGITPMEEILVNYVNQHVSGGGGKKIQDRLSLLEDAKYMKDAFIEGGEIQPGSKADKNWDRSALQAARIFEVMSRRKDFGEFISQLSSYPDPFEE